MSAPNKNDIFGISTSRRIDWYIKIDIFRWGGEKGSPANLEISESFSLHLSFNRQYGYICFISMKWDRLFKTLRFMLNFKNSPE